MSADLMIRVTPGPMTPRPDTRIKTDPQAPAPLPAVETLESNQKPQEVRQVLPQGGKEVPPAGQEPDEEEVSEAVGRINDFVQSIHRSLEFTVDKNSGRTIITVYDSETKEIVRQIPPEEVLSLVQNLEKHVNGLLFMTKA